MDNTTENNTQVTTNQSKHGLGWFVEFLTAIGVIAKAVVGIVDVLSKAVNRQR